MRPFRFSCADVAADFPVNEAERVRHDVTNVGQAQQHQGDAEDGVEDGHHLAPVRFWCYVTVTFEQRWIFVLFKGFAF
jgi:hypothetical protein